MEVRRVWRTLKPKSRFISADYNIPRCFLSLSLLFSHFSRIYYLADIIFLLQDRSSSSSSSFFSLKLIASSTSTHGSLRGILRYWPLKDMSLHSFLICLEKLQRGLKNRAPYEFRRDEISRFQFTRVCIVIRVYDFQRVLHARVCNYAFCNPIRFLKTIQYRNIYEVKVTTSCNSRLIGRINLQSLSSRREDENAFTFGQVERLIFTTIDVSTKRYFTVRRIGRYQRASVKIPNRI